MSRCSTRLRAPALLIAALAVLLVFAATAAAETRIGESTSAFAVAPSSPETTIVKGAASYDTTSGALVFNLTTAAEPHAEKAPGEPSEIEMVAGVFQVSECSSSVSSIEGVILPVASSPSLLLIETSYASPASMAITGTLSVPTPLPATKTVTGTTTTLSTSSGSVAEKGFNCALALVDDNETGGGSLMTFPIKTPPPPAPTPTPAPTPAPAVVPAPPVLSIAKPKPLKLAVGKSKIVKVKVTNTGATATAQGSLRVKPTKGVLVKPEVQKLPGLAPGASWTVSVRVQLTGKAKASSTLSLTGTASGVGATSSLVVKLKQQ